MNKKEIEYQIRKKKSFLSIGLDSDVNKIPNFLKKNEDPLFEFNKAIIDSTNKFCVCYKINTAFYESQGSRGWKSMEKTINYLNKNFPEIFTIADAKRGDIGNTSKMYADAFLKNMNFNSITVNPYMGSDSVKPFLEISNKFIIILALTSNNGSKDIQLKKIPGFMKENYVFSEVINSSRNWGDESNTMYVVGGTKPEFFKSIRKQIPKHFLLIPGFGAQGGDLNKICENSMNDEIGIIVNSSRSIIYASSGNKFDIAAAEAAEKVQNLMQQILK